MRFGVEQEPREKLSCPGCRVVQPVAADVELRGVPPRRSAAHAREDRKLQASGSGSAAILAGKAARPSLGRSFHVHALPDYLSAHHTPDAAVASHRQGEKA